MKTCLNYLAVASLICIICVQVLLASGTNVVTIRDKSHSVIGYIDGERVLDRNRHVLGYVRNGRTIDAKGNLIATPEVPGLLFCGSR